MGARTAVVHDAVEIVRLRRFMFESIGIDTGADDWEAGAVGHLGERLSDDSVFGAVIDAPGGLPALAAGGVIEFHQRVPAPTNPSGWLGYIGSVATDPRWQRQGHARLVMQALLAEAERRGVVNVELHATPAGLALYRELGFRPRGAGVEMRWAGPISTTIDSVGA